jgi:hypothetical protein
VKIELVAGTLLANVQQFKWRCMRRECVITIGARSPLPSGIGRAD